MRKRNTNIIFAFCSLCHFDCGKSATLVVNLPHQNRNRPQGVVVTNFVTLLVVWYTSCTILPLGPVLKSGHNIINYFQNNPQE
jgi:hypothetical protein